MIRCARESMEAHVSALKGRVGLAVSFRNWCMTDVATYYAGVFMAANGA